MQQSYEIFEIVLGYIVDIIGQNFYKLGLFD